MRTDELIEAMAADATQVGRAEVQSRLLFTAVAGGLVAFFLVMLWLGLRPDLREASKGTFFWVKAAYTAALGLAFYWACDRLARPGASANKAWIAAGIVLLGFAAVAVAQAIGGDEASRIADIRGVSWKVCTRNIVALGAPMTAIVLITLRGLAPTRPPLAGFAAGAFSGGVAATVYGLHCPEATFVFVALWYTLGVVICALLGGAAGRFLLRW